MTAPWWFVVAAVLVLCGVLLLALARRRTAEKGPDGHAAGRTGGGEGGYTDPPDPSLFEPATDPTPQPPTHWHTGDRT